MNNQRNGTEDSQDTEALRAGIDETRERLSADFDALGNKLSPENIKAGAKQAIKQTVHDGADQVRETVGSAGASLMTAAKENPLPVTLIGLGVGWLVWNLRTAATRKRSAAQPNYAVAGRAGVYDPRDPARMGADDVTSALDKAKTAARDGVRKTQETAVNAMEDHPMWIGALTVGVGVAVGLSIPATDSENQLVGQYRDRLLAKAKHRASDLADLAEDNLRGAANSGQQRAKTQSGEVGVSNDLPG